MLGKLFAQEMRALWKPAAIMLAVMVVAGVVGIGCIEATDAVSRAAGFASRYVNEASAASNLTVVFVMAALFCGFLVWASLVAVYVFIAMRFYRTMFTDEGYLTLTLPVRAGTLVAAKFWAAFLLAAAFFALSLAFVSYFSQKRKAEKLLLDTSRKIHQYMHSELEAEEIFPSEYAQVSTQIVQIKADMQQKERRLKEEAQKKNDLITYLAHDLKTPLTSVLGYLNLLEEAPDMPAAQREKYVHTALGKAERLDSLIEEFFEITRYNLQNMVLEKENLDVSYMMIQMTEEFYPVLSSGHNTVRLELPQEFFVYADSQKLARVFNNLLKNAIAYSYPDTEIVVRGEQQGEQAVISFENHGKTIPKQKLDLIFEKFFRMDEARKSNTGGAGLGLAIAKEIVELHGGSISAESKQEKTVFRVTLPEKPSN